jgi:hypothetical protein
MLGYFIRELEEDIVNRLSTPVFLAASIVASIVVSNNAFATGPGSCAALDKILSENQYNTVLQKVGATNIDPAYTYQGLCNAVNSQNHVFQGGNKTNNILALSAFLANTLHETGKFDYTTEVACSNGHGQPTGGDPESCSGNYGSVNGQACYGRGPLQLSHDYNYKAYYSAKGLPASTTPDTLLQQKYIYDTATWFWSTSKGQTQSTPEQGFQNITDINSYITQDPMGHSIMVINGGIECHTKDATGQAEAQARINFYKQIVPLIASFNNVDLSKYVNDNAKVGDTCTSTPTPKPAQANQLVVNYTGAWAKVQCFLDKDWDQSAETDAVLKTPTPMSGSEASGSHTVFCHPAGGAKVIFSGSSSNEKTTWRSSQGQTCSVQKDGSTLCSLADGS